MSVNFLKTIYDTSARIIEANVCNASNNSVPILFVVWQRCALQQVGLVSLMIACIAYG